MPIKINAEVAVIDDASFTLGDMQRVPLTASVTTLGELARQALEADVSQIWVLPACQISQAADRGFIERTSEEWDVFASYSRMEEHRPMFARIWRKKTPGRAGRTIYVGFPEWGTWPWNCSDGTTLLATVTYIESAVGLPPLWSPGRMALDLLKALNREHRVSWLSPLTTDLRTLPTNDGKPLPIMKCARDLTWKRPLTAREKKMRFVHKYDKNSMYLAAVTGLLVGEGDPEHVEGSAFDERLPGIWRVRGEQGDSPYDDVQLPSPLRTEWLTTAMVSCAKRMGYQVEIVEGYQWKQQGMYHRTLESWANTLWRVRQSLKAGSATFDPAFRHAHACQNAYRTIGAMAHIGIGKLGDEDTSGGLYRPDLWALTVGRACANMFHNIESIRTTTGLTPVLVYTDSLWYVSNDPDPETAVPGIVDRQDKLGGYKVVYEQPLALSKEVLDAFARVESPTKLVRFLNERAGEDATVVEKAKAEVGG